MSLYEKYHSEINSQHIYGIVSDIVNKEFGIVLDDITESRDDFQIAKDVNDSLDQEIPIVQEENPLKVKGIIKESKAVVTSRFHGLVSCLSQAIPCLSTAWSHKYKMLLEDYDYQNGLLEIDEKNLDDKLDTILLEDNRVKLIEKLKLKALKQKEKSNLMWEEVFKVVEE